MEVGRGRAEVCQEKGRRERGHSKEREQYVSERMVQSGIESRWMWEVGAVKNEARKTSR